MSDTPSQAINIPKTKKSKPSSVANAAIAREKRLNRIQERKDRELDEKIAARESVKKTKKVQTPVNTDESSDEDEDVIVYEPVVKKSTKRVYKKKVQDPEPSNNKTIELEEQLAQMNKRFKQLEDSHNSKNLNDQMINACKHKILNF